MRNKDNLIRWRKEYEARPNVRKRTRLWAKTPAQRKHRKQYYARPEVKAHRRKWMRLYKRKHARIDLYGPNGQSHYEKQLKSQNGRCYICLIKMIKPMQDHNHKCCRGTKRGCDNCLRGLLCLRCNTALSFIEGPTFNRAMKYIERWA